MGHIGPEWGEGAGELGHLVCFRDQLVGSLRKRADVGAGAVLQFKLETAGLSQAGDGRRVEAGNLGGWNGRELTLNLRENRDQLEVCGGALRPGLQNYKHAGHVGGRTASQQAKSSDGDNVLDTGRGLQYLRHLRRYRGRAAERGGAGQFDIN